MASGLPRNLSYNSHTPYRHQIEHCSKPLLVDYYMGLYYPIDGGLRQPIIGHPISRFGGFWMKHRD